MFYALQFCNFQYGNHLHTSACKLHFKEFPQLFRIKEQCQRTLGGGACLSETVATLDKNYLILNK